MLSYLILLNSGNRLALKASENGSSHEYKGSCHFYYLNTAPYGFILFDDKDVYFYQQPFTPSAD